MNQNDSQLSFLVGSSKYHTSKVRSAAYEKVCSEPRQQVL